MVELFLKSLIVTSECSHNWKYRDMFDLSTYIFFCPTTITY